MAKPDNIAKFYKAFSAEYDDFATEKEFRDFLGSASGARMKQLYTAFNEVYDDFDSEDDMNSYLGWSPQPLPNPFAVEPVNARTYGPDRQPLYSRAQRPVKETAVTSSQSGSGNPYTGKSYDELLAIKDEDNRDAGFINEYDKKWRKWQSDRDNDLVGPDIDAQKQWLDDNNARYRAAKEHRSQIDGAITMTPEYQDFMKGLDEDKAEAKKHIARKTVSTTGSGPGINFGPDPDEDVDKMDSGNWETAVRLLEMTKKVGKLGGKFDPGYSGNIGKQVMTAARQYAEAFAGNIDVDTFTMGLASGAALINSRAIGDRANKIVEDTVRDFGGKLDEEGLETAVDMALDKGLTDGEKAVLDALGKYSDMVALRSTNTSVAAKAGQGSEQSAEFMVDFILTGGLAKSGAKMSNAIAKNALKKRLGHTAGKKGLANIAKDTPGALAKLTAKGIKPNIGAKFLGDAVVAAERTALMFPRNLRAYGEALTETVQTDDGNIRFARNWGNAALNTAMTQYIEYWSEGFGEYFGAGEAALWKAATRRAPATAIGKTLTAYRGSIGRFLDNAKFDGMLNEMLEEVVGSLFNASAGWLSGDRLGDSGAMKDFFSGEQLATLFFSFLPMSAVSASTNIRAYNKMRSRYNQSVDALQPFVEDGSITKEDLEGLVADITDSTPVHIKDRMVVISDKARAKNGGHLPANFSQSLMGYVEGTLSMRMEGDKWQDSAEKTQVAQAYTEAYGSLVEENAWDAALLENESRNVAIAAGSTQDELEKDPYRMAQDALALRETNPQMAETLLAVAKAKAHRMGLEDGYKEETGAIEQSLSDSIKAELDNDGTVIIAKLPDGEQVFVTSKDASVEGNTVKVNGADGVVEVTRGIGQSLTTVKASGLKDAVAVTTADFERNQLMALHEAREKRYTDAVSTISRNGKRLAIEERTGQTVYISDGRGVYEPVTIKKTTRQGHGAVVTGDSNVLTGIASALRLDVPRSRNLELPSESLYALLAKEEDGSIATEAPKLMAMPTREARQGAPGLVETLGNTYQIYVGGQPYTVEVTGVNENEGKVSVNYKDAEGNDIPSPPGLPMSFNYGKFTEAMREPVKQVPVEKEPDTAPVPKQAEHETMSNRTDDEWLAETVTALYGEDMTEEERNDFLSALESELSGLEQKRGELIAKRKSEKPVMTTDLKAYQDAKESLRNKYGRQIDALEQEIESKKRRLEGLRSAMDQTEAEAAAKGTPVPMEQQTVEENNIPVENPEAEAVRLARLDVDTEPTEAQKEAGNYKKGHVRIDGHDITIENPKGSVRKGTDENGKVWKSEMHNDYGYIRGTESVDGDHIDVFLSDNPDQGNVFVVDQVNQKTGEFDEHKVMYGFNSLEEARAAYLSNYEEGWQGLGNITEATREEFKKWVDSSHRKTKPFAEYKSVKPVEQAPQVELNEETYREKYFHNSLPNVPFKPYNEIKRPKFDINKFTAAKSKNSTLHPSYKGVLHHDGYKLAYDGYLMVAVKEAYPKTEEGKTFLKDGKEVGTSNTVKNNWKNIVAKVNQDAGLYWKRMASFVDGLKTVYGKAFKDIVVGVPVNGRTFFFRGPVLDRFLQAAGEFGAKSVKYTTVGSFAVNLKVEGDKGVAIVVGNAKLPIVYSGNVNYYNAPAQLEQLAQQREHEPKSADSTGNNSFGKNKQEGKNENLSDFAQKMFGESLKQVPEEMQARITVRESSTGDESQENFVQSYDLDGRPSGVTRIDLFEAGPDENPTRFVIDSSDVDAPVRMREKWEALAKEYHKEHPDVGISILDEAGIAFRNFNDALQFRQWAEAQQGTEEKEGEKSAQTSTSKKRDGKIEDFGEKIGGARKDLAREYRESLSEVSDDDLRSQPLSKVFPRPNLKAMVENGQLTQDNALAINYLYGEIPAKPRKHYKLEHWLRQVRSAMETVETILQKNGEFNALDFLKERLSARNAGFHYFRNGEVAEVTKEQREALNDDIMRLKVLKDLGFPTSGIALGNASIKYSIHSGERYDVSVNGRVSQFETYDEALDYLRGELKNPSKKETVFNVYINRQTGKCFVGKPIQGKDPVCLSEMFGTAREAREYLLDHWGEIQLKWDAMHVRPEERRSENRERAGRDWRGGEDVIPERFQETFGFLGTEFGNWVNQAERQDALNSAYDALMDMSSILDISPKALSLNGELGMAFGARGTGNAGGSTAVAHYEPGKVVINLTKTKGAGSLAHEWWHALDNYFSRTGGKSVGYATTNASGLDEKVRQEMKDAFGSLMRAIRSSGLPERSGVLDRLKSKDYWSTDTEMSARSFENYVASLLAEKGDSNDYLVNFKAMEEWMKSGQFMEDSYPYPTVEESHAINEKFRQFFDTIQERTDEDSGNTILFQVMKDILKKYGGEAGRLATEVAEDLVRATGIKVETVSDAEAGAKLNNMDVARLNARQKKALETASPAKRDHQTVVSSAHGSNIIKNIDDAIIEYENVKGNKPNTFIGDVAKALSARRHGSGSEYATFETVNGRIVTIRIANHNGKVSMFDNHGENDGISIVITPKDNDKLMNDGNAHIVEFYYDAVKLRRADGKPLAEILKSIKQALYSGEYKDTTGLAEREEVNIPAAQFLRDGEGTVYGWTEGGKIYLNRDRINPETPIHEYAHLWFEGLRKANPALYGRGVELMKQLPVWDKVKGDGAYSRLVDDHDVASECLARLTGRNGAEKLEEISGEVLKERNLLGVARKLFAIERFREWLKEFWTWVRDTFSPWSSKEAAKVSADDIQNMILSDFIKGRNPNEVKPEREQIVERAKADGTYMKAPNGKPTKLTERQWVQVRTKAFKDWFGDWERAARIKKLKRSEPVEITGEEHKGKYELNRDSAKAWIKDNLRGEYTIVDTGEKVVVGRKGVNKVTSHSMGNEAHLKSLIAVPAMLHNATFIVEERAEKANAQYLYYRYYVVGLNIGGVDYTAKLTIGVDENGNKYYDHALTEIEKGKLLDQNDGQAAVSGFISTGAEPGLSVTIGKDTKLFSILQINSSKVVDENGEPLVVYHSTDNDFHVFSRERLGENTDWNATDESFAAAHLGFWFNTGRLSEFLGQERDMTVFLDIRDPMEFDSLESLAEEMEDTSADEFIEDRVEYYGHDGIVLTHDEEMGGASYVALRPGQVKSATDNNGDFSNENPDIRFHARAVGGNSGYIGYSMSRRAAEAREEGRFPKTDFKKEYGVTDKSLSALVKAGIVSDKEWHHTSKYGNKTTFYSWDEPWMADAYTEMKDDIDKLARTESDGRQEIIWELIEGSRAHEEYLAAEKRIREQPDESIKESKLLHEYDKEMAAKVPEEVRVSSGAIVNMRDGSVTKDGRALTKRYRKQERDAAREEARRMTIPDISFTEWKVAREGRFTEDYKLDPNKDYYIRWAFRMDADMKRGWSSYNFGKGVLYGNAESVLEQLESIAEQGGGEVDFGLTSGVWIDEDTRIYKKGESIFVDDFELREFEPGGGEWVVVDNVNAKNGLSAHRLPEGLQTVKDVLKLTADEPYNYDGSGDGESFTASDSRVVYESEPDKWGKRMYVVEEGAEHPDRIVSLRVDGSVDKKDTQLNETREDEPANPIPAGIAGAVTVEHAIDNLGDKLHVRINKVNRDQMPRGHRMDKGYFDTRSGEVYVCVDNVLSIDDAISTVLHESVSHLGLRKLFGDQFPETMRSIYEALDTETRRTVNASMSSNGWDAITALEEYMARLAEKTDFNERERTLWQRIEDVFGEVLLYLTGWNAVRIEDSDLRYILRASYENLRDHRYTETVQGWARDVAMRSELGVNEYVEPEYLFSAPTFADGTDSVVNYEDAIHQRWQVVQMEHQDGQQAVRIGINAVQAETGNKPIEEDEDYLTKQNLSSSRAQTEQDEYMLFKMKPILEQVRALQQILHGSGKMSDKQRKAYYQDIITYIYAKSGAERNRYSNNQPDAEVKDWSGLTSLFDLDKSAHEEAEYLADRLVARFEDRVGMEETERLWDVIRSATDYNLRHALEHGLLSREEYDRLHGNEGKDIPRMWEHYVPLRGFREDTAEDVYNYSSLTSQTANGVVVKKYKGRISLAEDPLANIANIAMTEITQGNDNLARIALYKFVLNRSGNKLLAARDVWYEKTPDGRWATTEPRSGETLETFEERMKEESMAGYARLGRKGLELDMIMANAGHRAEHLIRLKVNGVEKAIWVNGDPLLARAVSGSLRTRGMRKLKAVTRALSNLFTTYSIDFISRNFFRDLMYSRMRLLALNDKEYTAAYSANWWRNLGYSPLNIPMIQIISQWQDGTLQRKAKPTERERLFMDFMRDGGPTGYTIMHSVDRIKKDIMREIGNGARGGRSTIRKVLGFYPRAVQTLNEAYELLTRFTAYETSRQLGRSGQRSASDAKEISVNFNRKGAQTGEGFWGATAAFMGSTHYFYNAGVQGFQNFTNLYRKHPYRMTAATAGLMLAGFMTPFINALLAALTPGDDDDDWYWSLPQWVRRNNLVIGFKGYYLAIPLAVEQRAIYGLGDIAAAFAEHKVHKDFWAVAFDALTQAGGILPVNPVEDYTSSGNVAQAALRAAMPDALMVVVDLATNKDFTGKNLQKERPYDNTMPMCYGAYSSTPAGIVKACQKLAEVTAASGNRIDLPPGYIRDIFKQYGGGLYSAFEDASKFIAGLFDPDKPARIDDIPFISGFVGHLDDDRRDSFVRNTLNDYKNNMEDVAKDIKIMAKAPDITLKAIYDGKTLDGRAGLQSIYQGRRYELGKMYYRGKSKVTKLRKAWAKQVEAYSTMPHDTEDEKRAREAKALKVQNAWQKYYDAECNLVDKLLSYEYSGTPLSEKLIQAIAK